MGAKVKETKHEVPKPSPFPIPLEYPPAPCSHQLDWITSFSFVPRICGPWHLATKRLWGFWLLWEPVVFFHLDTEILALASQRSGRWEKQVSSPSKGLCGVFGATVRLITSEVWLSTLDLASDSWSLSLLWTFLIKHWHLPTSSDSSGLTMEKQLTRNDFPET